MLYLIGLGLDADGISKKGLEAIKKCDKVYLENYTAEIPYSKEDLEKIINKKVNLADRNFVESLRILDETKNTDIALLVYGSPLTATTHISLIQEAKKSGVKSEIIHNASILDAVAETGLQLYKFGKIASIPKYQENYKPDSFIDIVKNNQKISAHSLILADIGLKPEEAAEQLIKAGRGKIKLDKVVVCSRLGCEDKKIFYDKIENLQNKNIKKPFCIIIPGELHFVEKNMLEKFE